MRFPFAIVKLKRVNESSIGNFIFSQVFLVHFGDFPYSIARIIFFMFVDEAIVTFRAGK